MIANEFYKGAIKFLEASGVSLSEPLTVDKIEVGASQKKEHGDFYVNVAMKLTKTLRKPPLVIANELIKFVECLYFEKIEVVPPGFINIFLSKSYYADYMSYALAHQDDFYKSEIGKGTRILVEFVSANPTGPLHVGHGRGATYGDALSSVLRVAGYDVETEYYINDAGNQLNILGRSIAFRASQEAGNSRFVIDEETGDYYRGGYIKDIAHSLLEKEPNLWSFEDSAILERCKIFGKDIILEDIKEDLQTYGVTFDRWFSEKSLYDSGAVPRYVALLEKNGFIYEQDGAKWFRSTQFGDEKDRVVMRSNGEYTYFASDIAYHADKYERGFNELVNVVGADHHGYVARLTGVVSALGYDSSTFFFKLIQIVNLLESGERVSMSTRAGKFYDLRDLYKEVGIDATRFFYASRSIDSMFDFDIDLAKSKSNENPVYYVQYANARIHTLRTRLAEHGISYDEGNFDLSQLGELELTLLKKVLMFNVSIELSALHKEPHRLCNYLIELARDFHNYYASNRLIGRDPIYVGVAMRVLRVVSLVIEKGLGVLKVSAPSTM